MKRTNWILLLTLFVTTFAYPQEDSIINKLELFVNNIETFNRLYPQEKVYLHFDNTGYYLGETIWFKAYIVAASNLRPEPPSGVLYVELLNSRGIVLETKKLKIVDGQCHGDFFLTLFNYDYHAGYYEVRAYTKAMLNFGDEVVFSRVFPVFNEPPKQGEYAKADMKEGGVIKRLNMPNKRKAMPKAKKVNLDFYPESGNLVKGLTSLVAFKATDERGIGIDITGEVKSPTGETLASFSTQHDGMGLFSYTPQDSKDKIEIRYKNNTYKFDLPESLPEGYILKVNNMSKKNLVLQIEKTAGIPATPLGLSILCRGQAVYFQSLQPDSQAIVIQIPKEELPEGVNQITLFDSKGEIFAERLVFISPSQEEEQQYIIETKLNKNIYKPQERITIECSAEPETVFSLSVRDAATTIDTPDTGNIFTDLLLSSDLKGYIENPSYYLQDNNSTRMALDLLMMVQGWRRYEWRQMAGLEPFLAEYNIEKGLEIKGKVYGNTKEVNIELALDNDKFLVDTAKTDSLGNFKTAIKDDLYGKYYLLLNSHGLKNADKNIRLDRWFSPAPKPYSYYDTKTWKIEAKEEDSMQVIEDKQVFKEMDVKIDSLYKQYEIKELEVQAKRGKDFIYNVERDREMAVDEGKYYAVNAREYMIEKNNAYLFKSQNSSLPDNVAHAGYSQWEENFVLYFLCMDEGGKWTGMDRKMFDKSPLSPKNTQYRDVGGHITYYIDLEHIQKIIICDWEKTIISYKSEVYVHISGYLYTNERIVYFPYRMDANYRVSSFEGYSTEKDFYIGRPERENYIPDSSEHSRTLYWNPDVKTDKEGKAQISFYNNAFCRQPEIAAEGLTKYGIPVANRKGGEY